MQVDMSTALMKGPNKIGAGARLLVALYQKILAFLPQYRVLDRRSPDLTPIVFIHFAPGLLDGTPTVLEFLLSIVDPR